MTSSDTREYSCRHVVTFLCLTLSACGPRAGDSSEAKEPTSPHPVEKTATARDGADKATRHPNAKSPAAPLKGLSNSRDAAVKGTLVGAAAGAPIPAAEVEIRRGGRVVATIQTDERGRYSAELAPGYYEIRFKSGKSSLTRFFAAHRDKIAKVNGRMSEREGEVIIIEEKRLARRATARNFNAQRTPPYSDRAITANHWGLAWLLLDVSKKGAVTRLKFINRPGYDLDEIAVAEAFKLEFNPSYNEDGEPITTLVVWSFEWPAYWWLVDRMGSSSASPRDNNPFWGTAGPSAPAGVAPLRKRSGELPQAEATTTPKSGFGTGFRNVTGRTSTPTNRLRRLVDSVPCLGSAPIESGSVSAALRNCTRPALDKLFDSESWVYPKGSGSRQR